MNDKCVQSTHPHKLSVIVYPGRNENPALLAAAVRACRGIAEAYEKQQIDETDRRPAPKESVTSADSTRP